MELTPLMTAPASDRDRLINTSTPTADDITSLEGAHHTGFIGQIVSFKNAPLGGMVDLTLRVDGTFKYAALKATDVLRVPLVFRVSHLVYVPDGDEEVDWAEILRELGD